MNNIFIFGDSFSFSNHNKLWTLKLSQHKKKNLLNYSSNASSIFRIYKNLKDNYNHITKKDFIIINYTNYQRIYINDDFIFKTRKKKDYSKADLVINDVFNLPILERFFLKKIYFSIYDDNQQLEMYDLIKKEIRSKLIGYNYLEITFFDFDNEIKNNFNDIWKNNPGYINHLDENGNNIIFDYLKNI